MASLGKDGRLSALLCLGCMPGLGAAEPGLRTLVASGVLGPGHGFVMCPRQLDANAESALANEPITGEVAAYILGTGAE